LLNVWLGQSNEICVVGDPTQSIYEFAGAVPNLLREFVAQPNTQLISLNRSYRLAQEITNVANPIASWLGEQPLLSDRVGGQVSVTPFANQDAEVQGVVSQIKSLNANGISFGSMAVLLRTGAQVNEFATALERENIPIVTRGASRFIDSNLVKHALLALKAGGDSSAITVSEAVIAVAQGLGWRDVWADATIALNDWLGLSSLVQLSKTEVASVTEFLDVVGDRVLAAAEPPADAISILTIHQAKGLEWDCVFLPRFNEVPGMQEADLVAEARVQFVAVTRARNEVRISFAESDKFGRALELSRFVSQDLPAAPKLSLEFVTAVSPAEVREQIEPIFCESCAAALRAPIEIMTRLCAKCVPAPDSELLDRLLKLRSKLASERGVPNWALVNDSAISALSIRPPASSAELRHFPALQRLSDEELEAFRNLWH
jgi:DNA helicase-2/ATP-dependent DNA helicase PcrA